MNIYYNANIFSPGNPEATAFAVENGYFLFLGSDEDILNLRFDADQKIDLQGKTIWPGLTDAHVHLKLLADSMAIVDCETDTLEECLQRIKAKSKELPKTSWILGHGWNHNKWERGYGTAEILDSVTGGRPAYLTAKSLHASWVNRQALNLAGIDNQIQDPPDGEIQRDSKDKPTGILFESGAMSLVEAVIPKPTQEEITLSIRSIIPELWKMGIVGLHDFDRFECWQSLQHLYQLHDLKLRIRKNIPYDYFDYFIQAGLRTDYGDDWLQIGSLKLFADGALGPQTAAMIDSYEGSNNFGKLLLSEDEIFDVGRKAVDNGIALSIHAIGDRANEIVLNAFSRLRGYEKSKNLPHLQHRIEHVQIINKKDLIRMRELDIIASLQPVHAPSDMYIAEKYLGNQSEKAYAYRSMIDTGVKIVCGSDAPVEPVNPFLGLHAAVTRRTQYGLPGSEGWHPEQKISLFEALMGFSHNPAVIASRGDHLGKIAEGYKADFLVLDQDPFKLDPQIIAKLKPCATFIEGKCVYNCSDRNF